MVVLPRLFHMVSLGTFLGDASVANLYRLLCKKGTVRVAAHGA